MYLVRTIHLDERASWIDQLGVDPKVTLPLPVIPRRQFNKVIVIHGQRVLGFDLDRLKHVNSKNVIVGSQGTIVIKARTLIYVKVGIPRIGSATIRGFQGIRYVVRWSDVAS